MDPEGFKVNLVDLEGFNVYSLELRVSRDKLVELGVVLGALPEADGPVARP